MALKKRRLQIPISAADERLVRAAAKLYQISAAEWLRRIAIKAAKNDLVLAKQQNLSPFEALEALGKLEGPVGSIEEISRESVKGRLY